MAELIDTQRTRLDAALVETGCHGFQGDHPDLYAEAESIIREHVTAALEEAAARIEGAPNFTFKRNLDRVRAADIVYRYRNEVRGYRQEQDR